MRRSFPSERRADAARCFAAFHLFADPMRALDRMTAVLTPGGRIALFTTARNCLAPVRSAESVLAPMAHDSSSSPSSWMR